MADRASDDGEDLSTAFQGLEPRQILAAVDKVIDDILGKGSSNLLFRTLAILYEFDEHGVPSDPKRFDELMTKALGANTARSIRRKIIRELKRLKRRKSRP